jgi:environmental stress-induced protein Ves
MELDVQSCTDEVIHSDLRKGQNVTLNSNTLRNQRTLLLNHSPPFHFSGDLKTTATLIADQPLLDFNIMTRRNVFMQDTKRITIPPVLKHDVEGCRGVDLSVDGVAFVVIHANTGSVSVASHAHHASVQSGDTCVITVDSSVKILHPWVSVRGSNDFCDFIFAIVRSTDLDAPP